MKVEVPDWMLELSRQLNTQDNRGTADPVWELRVRKKVWGFDETTANAFGWLYRDDYVEVEDEPLLESDELSLLEAYDSLHIMWEDYDYHHLWDGDEDEPGHTPRPRTLVEWLDAHYREYHEDYVGPYFRSGWRERVEVHKTFMTLAGLEEYLEINGHNVPKDRVVYVNCNYRNREYTRLREWLMSLTDEG
jgi:hypothetical protein